MAKQKKPLYDPETGIHRAKLWEIALYALNNSSTNIYMMAFMYVTYFLTGFCGVGVVLAVPLPPSCVSGTALPTPLLV